MVGLQISVIRTAATYNALVKTNSLDLGYILRNDQFKNISANVTVSGKGFTPGKAEYKI